MLSLSSLEVAFTNVDSRTLTWGFSPTSESLTSYQIDVYRSESPGTSLDGYDSIATDVASSAYSYTDNTIAGLYDPDRVWYYKLDIKNVNTLETSTQPARPAYVNDSSADRPWIEIKRRKYKALSKKSGRVMRILKRRTYGTHCSACWDSVTQRIKRDNDCTTCHGTGWDGGYFDPIYVYAMMNPSPTYNQITMYGEWRPSDSLLTVLDFPPLKTRDVIVDDHGKRWAVRAVKKLERKGFIIEQQAQCSLIAFDDKVYDV